ncbi:hypothetical protein [Pontibacter harenae]|uniref:hypothetical protein n=1 Tax=Pontibacter harenae TaxID=2894083 RepID=UPI001E2DAC5D|nr:hypothetical protein [Pontibacter harenae]MCC9167993.1 hypothetical protein [Pontibacter harenae]
MPKFSREEYPPNSNPFDKVCPYCSRAFWTIKPRTIYCSPKCRVYANKKKREAQVAGTAEHKQPHPTQGGSNTVPMITAEGKNMRMVFYDPFDEKLREIDPVGELELRHHSGVAVLSEETLAELYNLRLSSCELRKRNARHVLQEDSIMNHRFLTPQQSRFLAQEQARMEAETQRLRTILQRLDRAKNPSLFDIM